MSQAPTHTSDDESVFAGQMEIAHLQTKIAGVESESASKGRRILQLEEELGHMLTELENSEVRQAELEAQIDFMKERRPYQRGVRACSPASPHRGIATRRLRKYALHPLHLDPLFCVGARVSPPPHSHGALTIGGNSRALAALPGGSRR